MKEKVNEKKIEFLRKLSLSLFIMFFVLVIVTFVLILFFNLLKNLSVFMIIIVIMTAMVGFGALIREKIEPELARLLMSKLNTSIQNLQFLPKKGIPEPIFRASNYVSKYTKYRSINYVDGTVEKIDFIFSDVAVYKEMKSKDGNVEKALLYKGLFGVIDTEKQDRIQFNYLP